MQIYINSAIHKTASSLATSCSQQVTGRNYPPPPRVFQPVVPIHRLWDIFQWNGGTVELYQSNYGTAGNREAGSFVNSAVNVLYSAIYKAAGRAVPGFAWYNSCGTEKCPLAVNGSRRQERPPEVVLYGGRPYGGFVNSAVTHSMTTQCISKIFYLFKHCTNETHERFNTRESMGSFIGMCLWIGFSDGSRIFLRGGANSQSGCAKPLYCNFLLKTT